VPLVAAQSHAGHHPPITIPIGASGAQALRSRYAKPTDDPVLERSLNGVGFGSVATDVRGAVNGSKGSRAVLQPALRRANGTRLRTRPIAAAAHRRRPEATPGPRPRPGSTGEHAQRLRRRPCARLDRVRQPRPPEPPQSHPAARARRSNARLDRSGSLDQPSADDRTQRLAAAVGREPSGATAVNPSVSARFIAISLQIATPVHWKFTASNVQYIGNSPSVELTALEQWN
jgi:hypothetical protein